MKIITTTAFFFYAFRFYSMSANTAFTMYYHG